MIPEDETAITEISIDPEGRIFLFGLSCEMLDVLASIFPNHPELMARIAKLKLRHNDCPDVQGNGQIENSFAPSAR